MRFEDVQDVSPGTLFGSLRPNANSLEAFCIDPLYVSNDLNWFSDPLQLRPSPSSTNIITLPSSNKVAGYDGSSFPSYSTFYNPSLNPSVNPISMRPFAIPHATGRIAFLAEYLDAHLDSSASCSSAKPRTDLINVRVDDRSIPVRLADISQGVQCCPLRVRDSSAVADSQWRIQLACHGESIIWRYVCKRRRRRSSESNE